MKLLPRSLKNSLGAVTIAGALAATSSGCGDSMETCHFTNPDKETARSLNEAESMCSANKNSILKCMIGDMDDHDIRIVSASCVDEATANETLEKAFDGGNMTACQTDAVIECKTVTDEGEETENR